jgi:glycerophosphoryl diester phosphodiesterase
MWVGLGRQVKWPGNKTVEDKFAEMLLKYGYGGKYLSKEWMKKPVFIQSFAPTALVKISKLIDSPLVFLIDDFTVRTQDTDLVSHHHLVLIEKRQQINLAK